MGKSHEAKSWTKNIKVAQVIQIFLVLWKRKETRVRPGISSQFAATRCTSLTEIRTLVKAVINDHTVSDF